MELRSGRQILQLLAHHPHWSSLFGLFALTYILMSTVLDPDKAALAKYHLTELQAELLALTIVLPYIVIWIIALVGYLRFNSYANTIKKTKDGAAFTIIGRGLLGLTLWLPLNTLISGISSRLYRSHPTLIDDLVRFNNYFSIVVLLCAFALLYYGANRLLGLVKRPRPTRLEIASWVTFAAVVIAYCILVFNNGAREHPTAEVPIASYYTADWITALTVVVPRIFMWYLGLRAVHAIYQYRRSTKGIIYKDSLHYIAAGVAFTIISIITLRILSSFPAQLGHLSLQAILAIVYALLALIAVGYVLIARGARRLQLIEEV